MSTDHRFGPLDDGEMAVWGSVATLVVRLPALLDAQLLRDSGVTHFEHGLLFALNGAPERTLRLSTLAAYASSSLSRLSRAISRLEKKDWVRRVPDPTDGRYTRAVLTEKGHHLLLESTPAHHDLVRRLVFDSLTRAQVDQLGVIADRLVAATGADTAWKAPAVGGDGRQATSWSEDGHAVTPEAGWS